MNFEQDLFISYTHIDNQPLIKGQEGWVDRFHFSLASLLSMWVGGKTKIWKDERLAGDDAFATQIVAQLPKTAVMLSVLSPRYIQSDWCKKEVEEFSEIAEKFFGLRIENKCRLVKVLKAPVDRHALPHPAMTETLGYEFYELGNDQVPREYDPYFGAEWGEKFLATMNKLAFELSQLLKLMHTSESLQKDAVEAPKLTVYLAECSYDQRGAREALDAELKRHGYRVLPDHELPKDEEAYSAEVAACLAQSQLSVHLIGSAYGLVPDGPSQKSVVVLQNELAIQRSHEKGLRRIIWIPEGIAPTKDEQIQFIDLLQKDAGAQFGADVVTAREQETIKGTIHAALQKLEEKSPTVATQAKQDGRRMIFLIFDEKDMMSTAPLNKMLKAHGFDVAIPVFEGDAAVVRQTNQELLAQASGVLVFYGEGGAPWKSSIDAELRKLGGSRDGKVIYTCLAGPETVAKQYLVATEEPNVLNCLPGISEQAVLPFLNAVDRIGA